MGRKKITPPIEGFGRDPEGKLTVQKSLPLFGLWRSGLTLSEFKIMDTYLSRIDSHKPEKRAVRFTKGELESLLGLKQIKPEVLDTRLKHLMETTVEISGGVGKRIDRITLFERGQAEQDENGQWTAILTCTPSAMKYIFNIENIRYLQYKLRSVINIKSLYSYILFTYLERNRYRKTWNVSLDELKHILNCENEELYKEFKFFNQKILKRCQKEIHEKTECRFIYEPVKKGRKVVAIKFTLETLSDQIAEQMKLTDIMNLPIGEDEDERYRIEYDSDTLWQEPLSSLNLTPEQLNELWTVLITIPLIRLPQVEGGIELQRYHYLEQKVAEITRRDSEKPIKHKFNYLLKIIKQDAVV